MSEEKIGANDFYQQDLLKGLQDLKKEITDINKETKSLIDTIKSALGTFKGYADEVKKGADSNKTLSDNQKKANETTVVTSKLEEERIKIHEKYTSTMAKYMLSKSEEAKKLDAANEKIKQENKLKKENETISKAQSLSILALNGSYKQIEAALNANILKYKSLTKEERDNSKIGGELIKTIQNQDKALKGLDSNMGRFNRNVGNYKSALSSLTSAFGVTGGLFAFASVVKNAFSEIKTFDKAMSELKSVAGATDKEFTQLKRSALELGRVTPKTATEVANLQTEFAKLGFTTPEILKVTAATIDLSIATGTDLANAATIAGSTLRGFQLPASEMPRILDVMAKGFATTALDIGNYSEAIKYVAPVAKAAGFSIEEVTAMLGKLADAGIRGSMAGTGLRRVFLEVAKMGGDPKEAFDKLAKSGLGLAEANDEVGDRAQTALLVLAAQKEEVKKLTTSYLDAKGSLKDMSDIMQDNLTGDITKATSAWSGFILGLDDGDGVITRVSRSIVQLWTDFVNMLSFANKSKEEVVAMAKESGIASQIEADIVEIERFGKSHKDVYGANFVTSLENAKKLYEDERESLKLKRVELLKNSSTEAKTLNDNANSIASLNDFIERDTRRIAAIKDYFTKKEQESLKQTTELTEKEKEKLAKEKEKREREWAKQTEMYVKGERQMIEESEKEEEARGVERARTMADIDKAYFEARINADEEIQKRLDASYLKDVENFKKAEEEKKKALEEIRNYQISSANEVVNIGISLGDRNIAKIEEQRDLDIAAAGDNAKKKEKIEADAAKKIAAIKKKQAIADKGMSLFNIFMSTRAAVMAIMAQLWVPFAVKTTQAAWTKIYGGLQAAAVLAAPIPKFFKGVNNLAKDTLGIVGDKAPGKSGDSFELVSTHRNGMFLTPNKATEMLLPKGSTVYPHEKTVEMMGGMKPEQVDKLISEQRLTRKAIANQVHHSTTITKDGFREETKRANNNINWLHKNFQS